MANMEHKRYLVFGFDGFYPAGGLDDIQCTFDLLEEAIVYAQKRNDRNTCIYDRIGGIVVWDNY